MKIAITGANGYLGKLIREHLITQGHSVIAGVRKEKNRKESENLIFKEFNLNFSEEQCSNFIKDCDAIIHLAYQKKKKGINTRTVNLEGTKNLFKASKNLKYKIHFSTMSAHSEAISDYGISKLEIEKELADKLEKQIKS